MNRADRSFVVLLLLSTACAPVRPPRDATRAMTRGTAPTVPFVLSVKEAGNKNMPGLQSFAMARSGGKWLLLGGRTYGFHLTSTAQSTFPTSASNQDLHVLDVQSDTAWKLPLPADVKTFLGSTNMASYQDGDVLYLVGGYGSNCEQDLPTCYETFPRLTAIRVPEMIQAVMNADAAAAARQIVSIADERFRVAGGGLKKLGDDFYLVFGQNYDSVYKGGYTGKYTEAVRRFRVRLEGNALAVTDYEEYKDPSASGVSSQYHRRDLNVVKAIRPNGSEGITVLGGVFTQNGGAWVNPVYIDKDAQGNIVIQVDTTFEQKTSQYECAAMLMFDPASRTMYTSLFGGISQYYYDDRGTLVPSNTDNWMPFVRSITTIARGPDGSTLERPQPPSRSLPVRMGSNAVFVPDPSLSLYGTSTEVLDYGKLPGGSVRVGYIYGGIWATADQSSQFNPTYASSKVYEVYLER